MTASDIKFEILKKIDSLENNQLEELHGVVLNFINSQKDETDWNLPEAQKQGILSAISEIEQGKGISHKNVMSKIRSITHNNLLNNETIVGFETDGTPFTRKQLLDDISDVRQQIEAKTLKTYSSDEVRRQIFGK